MKLQKIYFLIIFSSIILSSSACSLSNINSNTFENNIASNISTSDISISPDNTINERPISSEASQRVLLTNLTATDGSQSELFIVDSLHPAYKVWIDNQSNAEYTITITKDSPSGSTQDTYTVDAGQKDIHIYEISSASSFYLNISSKDGYTLKGQVGVRVASTYNEL